MARIVDLKDSPSRMLGDVPSQPGRAPVRAAREPVRTLTAPSGGWLGVRVDQSWSVETHYEVFVGRGGGPTSGNWQALGVPMPLYEDALALALSMFAQLSDPFLEDEARKARRLDRTGEGVWWSKP